MFKAFQEYKCILRENLQNQGYYNRLVCIFYPLKWSISFSFKQITVSQMNIGNMKISHFCYMCLQYADKCHFVLFLLSDLPI
jgi:hypothetical protein